MPGIALAAAMANWSGVTLTSPASVMACSGPSRKAWAAPGLVNRSRMNWISESIVSPSEIFDAIAGLTGVLKSTLWIPSPIGIGA